MSDNVKAAIIGAVSALLVTFIKDVVLDQIRRSRESKKALIDRKLTELYSPLWVAIGGGANTILQILSDDLAYAKLTANFHLLSEPLKIIIQALMKLGSGPDVRNPRMSADEQTKAIELQKEFVPLLDLEIKKLRSQYERC